MAVTRIKNNQITDLTVNAAAKLQDFSITSGKIANNLTYGSNLTITGNLTVQGNVTAIDTTDLVVEDPLFLLAKDQTGSPTLDIGFIGKRGTEDNIAWIWDESADQFAAAFTDSEITNTTINILSYASVKFLDIEASNLDITGNIEFSGNIVGNFVVTGNVDANNFNATSSITAGTTITATGNLAGNNAVITNDVGATTVTATGNISGGNITTAGVVAATGNVSGGNITTAGVVAATGNVSGGNITTVGVVAATGNVSGGNLTTAGAVVATGNVSGGNITTAGNIDGANVNASSGITAGTTVIATGNVSGGNITTAGNVDGANINAVTNVTTTTVTASGNVDAGTAVNANLIAGTGVQIQSTGDIVLNPTGNINVSGVRVRNMSDPQLAFDAATKQYVDDAVSAGIHVHQPVDVETTEPLTTVTYANGGNVFTVNETIAGNIVVFTTAANLQVNDQLWFDNSFNGVVGNLAYFVVSTPNTSAAVLTTAYNGVPVSNITSGSGLTESVRVNSGVGATLTATANGAIVVDGVSLSVGNRVMVNDQLNQIENGVYAVTDAGNVTAPFILTRSSDADTYEPQTSDGLDQGSYFYVESGDIGAGASYVKTAPSGPFIFGVANIVFTQFSSSQVYSANTQAGLVLNGTVFSAKVDNDTTAFDGGGNISVKAGANLVTPNIGDAIGNSLTLTGNGLLSATTVNATGNVSGGNIATVGNVDGANVNATAGITAGTTVIATGNVNGGNITTVGVVAATGNVSGGNLNTTGAVVATGNVTGGNISSAGNIDGANVNATSGITAGTTVVATGNVSGGNITTAGVVAATGNVSGGNITTAGVVAATGNVSGGNLVTTGTADLGNIRITGDDITNFASNIITVNSAGSDIDFRVSGDTIANLFVVDAGSDTVLIGTGTPTTNAALKIGTTNSILFPVGNTLQRPSTPVTGMVRFNTTIDSIEFYNSDSWTSVSSDFTVIVADEFTGDGSTVQFTLSEDSTTAATIVAINGVVQQPTTAYSVSGNVLTFTEAPESTDVIDARILTTTTTVTAIQNTSGNAVIETVETADTVLVTGNLLPSANITYNLGSNTARWNDIYLANSTIYLGNAQISANATSLILTNPSGAETVFSGATSAISVSEIIKIGSNGAGNIGSESSTFDTVFAKATSAQYADLAEMYEADAMYEPGTVLCFGGDKEVTLCGQADSTRVAGVVSTNPSYLMNSGQSGDYVIAVALTGRVPCRVTGTIRKGDLIVSTGDGRGRANNAAAVGTVIGKALADFDGADGVIEVVVGRV